MRNQLILVALLPFALLSSCGEQPVAVPDGKTTGSASADVPPDADRWVGRWTGVEGLFAEITPRDAKTYTVRMQSDLDTVGTYVARPDGDRLQLEIDGEKAFLVPGNGEATGLKYLAGKQECLVLREGAGFCRD